MSTHPDPAPWRMSDEDAGRIAHRLVNQVYPEGGEIARMYHDVLLDVHGPDDPYAGRSVLAAQVEAAVNEGLVPHPDQHGPEKCVPARSDTVASRVRSCIKNIEIIPETSSRADIVRMLETCLAAPAWPQPTKQGETRVAVWLRPETIKRMSRNYPHGEIGRALAAALTAQNGEAES